MSAPAPEGKPERDYGADEIRARMPIGEPFLFLDSASVGADSARGSYLIRGDEFFLRGHFKGNPVMPASVMLEALGQLGVFYLLTGLPAEIAGGVVDPASIFFASCDGVRCQRVCRPGDRLEFAIKTRRVKPPLAVLEGTVRVAGQRAVLAEEITLTFGPLKA